MPGLWRVGPLAFAGEDLDLPETMDYWENLLQWALRLAAAYFLALAVGLERGRIARKEGSRTFPLVALGACAYVLLGREIAAGSSDAEARIVQGLLSGIGFVGGGAIIKGRLEVHGLATAASLWNTGAIGVAAAYGRYELGALLAIANFATLRLVEPAHPGEEEDTR